MRSYRDELIEKAEMARFMAKLRAETKNEREAEPSARTRIRPLREDGLRDFGEDGRRW